MRGRLTDPAWRRHGLTFEDGDESTVMRALAVGIAVRVLLATIVFIAVVAV